MNLGEFRALTRDLPDDTIIVADPGDGEAEIHTDYTKVLGPVNVLGHPPLVILELGQPVWDELDIDARRDAQGL